MHIVFLWIASRNCMMDLEKIRNKSVVRIPVSNKVWQFVEETGMLKYLRWKSSFLPAVPKRKKNWAGHVRDHVIQGCGDVHWALWKSAAIIEATSNQSSGKWMIWSRADMLKFTLTLVLASLLQPQSRIKLLSPSGLMRSTEMQASSVG